MCFCHLISTPPNKQNPFTYITTPSLFLHLLSIPPNIEEFYVMPEDDTKVTLKHYMSNICETFDESIKSITDNLDKKDILKDGGTTIYKSKDKDITMIVCKTIDGNKDIFIGDYSMNFDSDSMCK